MNTQKIVFYILITLMMLLFLGKKLILKSNPSKKSEKCETRAAWVLPQFYQNKTRRYRFLKKAYTAHLNTLFVKIPNLYPLKGKQKEKLKQFLKHAHSLGFSLHGWIASSYRTKGKRADFLSDQEREQQALWVKNILKTFPLLKGIHLDYIRYPLPNYKYNLRKNLSSPKTKAVSLTVFNIYQKLKQEFPEKYLSAAVWTISDNGKLIQISDTIYPSHLKYFQNPLNWLNNNSVDFLVPMAYTKITKDWELEAKQWRLHSKENFKKIIMGLGWLKEKGKANWGYDAKALVEKIKLGRKLGIKGFSIFVIRDFYDPDKDNTDNDLELINALRYNSKINKQKAPFKEKAESCY